MQFLGVMSKDKIYSLSSEVLSFTNNNNNIYGDGQEEMVRTVLDRRRTNGEGSAQLYLSKLRSDGKGEKPTRSDNLYPSPLPKEEKIINFVITLSSVPHPSSIKVDANNHRLGSFLKNFKTFCEEGEESFASPNFEICPGYYHPVGGVGLTLAWLSCLSYARDTLGATGVIFYEDDSIPLDKSLCEAAGGGGGGGGGYNFVNAGGGGGPSINTHYSNIFKNAGHPRPLMVFLAGHQFVFPSKKVSVEHGALPFDYVKILKNYGTYGFGVDLTSESGGIGIPDYLAYALLACLSKSKPINQSESTKLRNAKQCPNLFSPEHALHDYAVEKGKNRVVYATNPTLVRHDKESYSNTWDAPRSSLQDVEWMDETDIMKLEHEKSKRPKRPKKSNPNSNQPEY